MKALPLLLLPLLYGCAASGNGASLAPRAIEQRGEEITVGDTSIAPPADQHTAALIDTLSAAVREGDTAFERTRMETESAVAAARGATASSEAWVTAQQSLSALDSARLPTTKALADLDALYIARVDLASTTPGTGGVAELLAARDAAAAVAERQSQTIRTLEKQLNPG